MTDILSRLTFGFVMAQLVPGTIAAFSALCAYRSFAEDLEKSLPSIGNKALALWTGSFSQQLLVLSLCAGVGMLIHGLHWAVVGFLENRPRANGYEGAATGSFWHNWPLFIQVILGPIKLTVELAMLLFLGSSIAEVAIRENVENIPSEKMQAFEFLQGFYLHFAQFFAHAAYALTFTILCGIICVWQCGFSWPRAGFLACIWMGAGLYFVIGRIQMEALFRAESHLVDGASS